MRKVGLYIHIPFCIKKCAYCDFKSYENSLEYRDAYIEAAGRELSGYKDALKGAVVDTVYIGGGTPSALSPAQIIRLGEHIRANAPVSPDAEFTFEANPDTGTREVFTAAREAGANRVSMGLQSASDEELKTLGRLHTVKRFEESFRLARECGFKNISLDLMTGLPGQSMESLFASADFAVSMAPEHISAYGLKIEEGTRFYEIKDSLPLPDEDTEADMYLGLTEYLSERGYRQYEISNYAKDGFYSRHNMRYWLGSEYIGIGCAAHSFFGGKRYFNAPGIEGYISAEKSGRSPVMECESLSREDMLTEHIMLRLRTVRGIRHDEFRAAFGFGFPERFKEEIEKYTSSGHMLSDGAHTSLTPRGFLLSNSIIADILLKI